MPRKIIFPLNERENWKGKGSVKHLGFSGKLGPLSSNLPHKPQVHVQVRQSSTFYTFKYLTKQLQSSVSVKKISFLVLCINVFLQQACYTTFWKICFNRVGGGGGFVKFLCCGKLLDFLFWVLKHTKIDAWKLDATF